MGDDAVREESLQKTVLLNLTKAILNFWMNCTLTWPPKQEDGNPVVFTI